MAEVEPGTWAVSDEILVQQARAGDVVSREDLFKRHFGISFRVAMRLLGEEQDALDAVQDAFLKAYRHLERFDGRSGFRTWLLRIVQNASLDVGRRRRRRSSIRLEDAIHAGNEVGRDDDPAAGLHQSDLRDVLNEALNRLSPNIRSTFVLFAEAEMSYEEIAEIQKIPVGTVMSRMHFARQKLQKFLGGTRVEGS